MLGVFVFQAWKSSSRHTDCSLHAALDQESARRLLERIKARPSVLNGVNICVTLVSDAILGRLNSILRDGAVCGNTLNSVW